jgi:hypothetical protein
MPYSTEARRGNALLLVKTSIANCKFTLQAQRPLLNLTFPSFLPDSVLEQDRSFHREAALPYSILGEYFTSPIIPPGGDNHYIDAACDYPLSLRFAQPKPGGCGEADILLQLHLRECGLL